MNKSIKSCEECVRSHVIEQILQLFDVFIIFRIIIPYGANSELILNLEITACLCDNDGTCNYDQTSTKSTYYKLASCNCLDFYEGIFDTSESYSSLTNNCFHLLGDLCERPYNGCRSESACRVNWLSNTTCTPKSVYEQRTSVGPYTCLGACVNGYSSTDNFTCNGRYSHVCKNELLYQSNRRYQ